MRTHLSTSSLIFILATPPFSLKCLIQALAPTKISHWTLTHIMLGKSSRIIRRLCTGALKRIPFATNTEL